MSYDRACFGTGETERAAVLGYAEFWEDGHIVVDLLCVIILGLFSPDSRAA